MRQKCTDSKARRPSFAKSFLASRSLSPGNKNEGPRRPPNITWRRRCVACLHPFTIASGRSRRNTDHRPDRGLHWPVHDDLVSLRALGVNMFVLTVARMWFEERLWDTLLGRACGMQLSHKISCRSKASGKGSCCLQIPWWIDSEQSSRSPYHR